MPSRKPVGPDLLLQEFDSLADTPDATAKLRQFILDLALRGKLVPQDPNDEPVSALLEAIRTQKSRLRNRSEPPEDELLVSPNETPFLVPLSWQWVGATAPALLVSDRGKKVPTKDILEVGTYPVIDQGKVFIRGYTEDSEKVIHVKEPIVLFGDHTRETKLIDFDFVVGADGVKLLQPICVDPSFYFLALRWLPIESRGYGRHFKLLRAAKIPLPPVHEQRRIVAKVEELLALCDELETRQTTAREHRTRLVHSALDHLTAAKDEQDFRKQCSFILHNSSLILDSVPALRQAILALAVQGKLVSQDPNDEPAETLLQRVDLEREQLVKAKRIRRQDFLGPVTDDAIPFSIPDSWQWRYLADVCFLITDGAHHTPQYQESGVPFLSVKDVSSGTIDFSSTRYISEDAHRELCKRCRPELGDILLTKVGTTGIAVTIDDSREFSLFVSLSLLKFSQHNLDRNYLKHLINSPFVRQQSADNTQGIGNKNLVLRLISRFTVPIPPLAEQQRIVAKVDELMRWCDALETRLAAAETTAAHLLDATLDRALKGEL